MAEVGLTASLITIAGAGGKVAFGFYEISDRLGLAAKEAKSLASEMKTLTSVLSLLSSCLDIEPTGRYSKHDTQNIAQQLVSLCQAEIECMQGLLADLTKLTERHWKSRSRALGQRVKFLFRKAKFQYHKTSIDSLKSSLTLLLSSLWESLQDEVKGQCAGARSAVSDLTNSLKQVDESPQTLTYEIEPSTDTATEDQPCVTTYPDGAGDSDSSMRAMSTNSAHLSIELLCDMTEHLQVQRSAQNFASGVLGEKISHDANWTYGGTASKSASFAETADLLQEAVAQNVPISSDLPKTSEDTDNSLPLPRKKTADSHEKFGGSLPSSPTRTASWLKRDEKNRPGSAATILSSKTSTIDETLNSSPQTPANGTKGSFQRSFETEKSADRERRQEEAEILQKQHQEEMEKREKKWKEEIEKRKVELEYLKKRLKDEGEMVQKLTPSNDDKQPPIKFQDAVGRKFTFPFRHCKTYKGIDDLIQQAFLHVQGTGEHVAAGHFDLVGPDGEIILPRVWDFMIRPDMKITMHMWPMADDPPEKTQQDNERVPLFMKDHGPDKGRKKAFGNELPTPKHTELRQRRRSTLGAKKRPSTQKDR